MSASIEHLRMHCQRQGCLERVDGVQNLMIGLSCKSPAAVQSGPVLFLPPCQCLVSFRQTSTGVLVHARLAGTFVLRLKQFNSYSMRMWFDQ